MPSLSPYSSILTLASLPTDLKSAPIQGFLAFLFGAVKTEPNFKKMTERNNFTVEELRWSLSNYKGSVYSVDAGSAAPASGTAIGYTAKTGAGVTVFGGPSLTRDKVYATDTNVLVGYSAEVKSILYTSFKAVADYMLGGKTSVTFNPGAGNFWPCFIPGYQHSVMEARAFGSQTGTIYGVDKDVTVNTGLVDTDGMLGFHNQYAEVANIAAITFDALESFIKHLMNGSSGLSGKMYVFMSRAAYAQARKVCINNDYWKLTRPDLAIKLGESFVLPTNSDVIIVEAPSLTGAVTGANTDTAPTAGKAVYAVALHEEAIFNWLTSEDMPNISRDVWQNDATYKALGNIAANQELLETVVSNNNSGVPAFNANVARMVRFQTPFHDGSLASETWVQRFEMISAWIPTRLSAIGIMVEA